MPTTPSRPTSSSTPLKLKTLKHEFVESVPTPLEFGVLYVSIRFKTAIHLCCCGCGNQVVTPISPAKWTLLFHGKTVSLYPSVGNWAQACKSHYWIRENAVVNAGMMSDSEIEKNRAHDASLRANYYAGNEVKANPPTGFLKKLLGK